ncbi:MAG: hypothetical protein QOD31_395, partial [Pseudonocardiales bacterium]|nr:hypothetical protein [Pseudonocardiales bacterium]
LGLAVLATVATSRTTQLVAEGHSMTSALTSGYHLAFWIAAGLMTAGLVVAATVLKDTPAPEQAPVSEDDHEYAAA